MYEHTSSLIPQLAQRGCWACPAVAEIRAAEQAQKKLQRLMDEEVEVGVKVNGV